MKITKQLILALPMLLLTASLQAAEPARSARIVLFVSDGSSVPADYETKLQRIAAVAEHFLANEIRRWGWPVEREAIFSRTIDGEVEILLVRGTIPADQTGRDALPTIRQTASSFVIDRYGSTATENDVLWVFYHAPDHSVQGFQGSGSSTGGLAINAYPVEEATIIPGVDLASPAMRELKIKGTMHELGHGLGLPHIGPKPSENAGNTLMGPTNNAYESRLPAGESDTRVYLSEASAAMLAKHPLFASHPLLEQPAPYSITVPRLTFSNGPDGQFTISGNVFSGGTAHSAVILDTSDSSSGYWSRPYRSGVAESGKFSLTIDDPFDHNTGTLALFFAHDDGRNSATGENEVTRGDTIEIAYAGTPGNRTFNPLSWIESSSSFDAILLSEGSSSTVESEIVTFSVAEITNYRPTGSTSGELTLQLWATDTPYSSGPLRGFKIAETNISPIGGGLSISDTRKTTSLVRPPDGDYNLVLVLTESNESTSVTVDHINLDQRKEFTSEPSLPHISIHPQNSTIGLHGSVTMTVLASGSPHPTLQWFSGETPIPGANNSTLTIDAAQERDAGIYRVNVMNSVGTVTSSPASLTVSLEADRPTLSNLSVRTSLAAAQSLVVGAVVEGGTKNILMRAGGPALDQFGLAGMPDPQMEFFDADQNPIITNDDWDVALADSFRQLGAYAFSNYSKDAALIQSIEGPFTVRVKGTGDGGAVLVEAYDLSGASSPRLVNVSARNRVGTGANVLIAGFVIKGSSPLRILIRAVGPTLANFGVTGVLEDPQLEVYNWENSKVLENDDWSPSLRASFETTGAFLLPEGSKDSAIVAEIPPGSYTVQVSGADGGTGEAIIELYELK